MRPRQALTSLLAFPSLTNADGVENVRQAATHDWNSIRPSKSLEYHGCYQNAAQCARLILPLDYKNPNDTRNVIVAILKHPAAVPENHPTFGGSIFLNPGGPGGSATEMARTVGPEFQRRLERSGRRHYEYIGIDPRGIGFSWPPANCFPDDLFSRQILKTETRGLGPLDEGDRTVPYGLALHDGFGQRCLTADSSGANGGPIMAYAGTASVARDMVEVTDRIEELRRKGANKSSSATNSTRQDVARVQYMGFSYGTVLGHYLVSLFPERVGRIVLDGVVDAQDYSTGPGWTRNLIDTDKIYTDFFKGCHLNPSTCALSRKDDTSGADVQHRFERWLHTIQKAPITSIGPSGDIRVLPASGVRSYMGDAFYTPLATFKDMASRLDKAMNGNATALFEAYFQDLTPQHTKKGCVFDEIQGPDGGDGGVPVLCGDGDDVSGKDAGWWRRYSKQLVSQSSIYGAQWATIRFRCSRWPFKSNWQFKGPFTAPAPKVDAGGKPVPGYPAAPNLYLTSRLDPVTPLVNAREMRKRYPGSGLVIVEGAGHTAVNAEGNSECFASALATYLETGSVPEKELICQPECGPWQETCQGRGLSGLAKRHDARSAGNRPKFPLGVEWL